MPFILSSFLPAFASNLGLAPKKLKGPQALPITLDFTSVLQYQFDLTTGAIQAGIDTLQGMFIDNSNNPFKISFLFPATNQVVVVPAFSQATFPVLGKVSGAVQAQSGNQSIFANTPAVCNIFFLNIPTPFASWTSREQGLYTNYFSNSVGTGLTLILGSNPLRRRFQVCNTTPSSTMNLFFTDGSTGNACWQLGANQSYDSGPADGNGGCYIGNVQAFGSVTLNYSITEYIDATVPATFSISRREPF